MSASYFFYDLETSGLNKAFDQVQQFAAKRCGQDFSVTDTHFLEARLSPDIIPSAYAMITHRVGLNEEKERLSEYQVVSRIHQLINQPGTISLGYNTLGFDDEFLRFAFFRNLFEVYTHQYANGCIRMDVFPLVVFYYLYAKHTLKWPEVDGVLSLKLESLAKENAWESGRAHHAMNDVDVTIRLAKHLAQSDQKMWEYLTGFFHKKMDQERTMALDKIKIAGSQQPIGLLIHTKLGYKSSYQAPYILLGQHQIFKNQTVWLRLDKESVETCLDNSLMKKGLVMQKKWGEPGFFLPFSDRYRDKMDGDRVALAMDNINKLQHDANMWDDLRQQALSWEYPVIEGVDIDASLYQVGFRSQEESMFCRKWHSVSEAQRCQMVRSLPDSLLKSQALRCLWRHNPAIEDAVAQEDRNACIAAIMQDNEKVWIDYRGKLKYTAEQAYRDVADLGKQALDSEQVALLGMLKDYIATIRQDVGV
ncbi:MAG: exonuclease domain-containing protein [Pseudomonadota bacterium]|nr:exonuclease domain-containing protein [Pseudomonadota bacterium]